jgi:FkbM family methyltransferase
MIARLFATAVSISTLAPLTPITFQSPVIFMIRDGPALMLSRPYHFYPLLCEARQRDTNLQCAIGNNAGLATFYEIPKFAENSTIERPIADRLAAADLAATPHEVEVIRLADLCDAHVKDRTIDFMKIDVEGAELGVLQSGDGRDTARGF